MQAAADFSKKHAASIQIILVMVAFFFLSFQITRPLVDYDEATYAKVVVDTLRSGHVVTFHLADHDWFEKPPLYLWLAMGSVKMFGDQEFAFRLPAIFLAVISLWLVFALVKEFANDILTSSLAFLILLSSNVFFVFAREARTDQGVIASILAALLFCVKGWENPKYLSWVFPAIALGFLFKSVIAALAFPTILIYSIFYRQWGWVKSKYLWWGFLLSLFIIVPWHVLETVQFGWTFWNDYLGHQIFQRAVVTLTGQNNYYDYLYSLSIWVPWNGTLITLLAILGMMKYLRRFKDLITFRALGAPLAVALCIVGLFTVAKTHLTPYIMPAFPFLAIGIALSFRQLALLFKENIYITYALYTLCTVLVLSGLYILYVVRDVMIPPLTFEEKAIGEIYKADPSAPMYVLDWTVLETLNYYAHTNVTFVSSTETGRVLKAPFYLVVDRRGADYLYKHGSGQGVRGLKAVYAGQLLALLHDDTDLVLPAFK